MKTLIDCLRESNDFAAGASSLLSPPCSLLQRRSRPRAREGSPCVQSWAGRRGRGEIACRGRREREEEEEEEGRGAPCSFFFDLDLDPPPCSLAPFSLLKTHPQTIHPDPSPQLRHLWLRRALRRPRHGAAGGGQVYRARGHGKRGVFTNFLSPRRNRDPKEQREKDSKSKNLK